MARRKRSVRTEKKIVNPDRQSLTIDGFSVGLGKRLKKPDDWFTLYQEASFQHYTLDNFRQTFTFNNGFANNINYKISLSRNSFNDVIWIKYGSQVSFTAQLTPPYSYFNNKDYKTISDQEKYKFVEYQKYKFTAGWYTPLTNKKAAEGKTAHDLVLHTKIGFGFLGMYNQTVGLAPFERFYLGGSGLTGFALDGREIIALRGYDDQSLTPTNNTGSAIGAAVVSKYTMELRYPISLNPQAMIFTLAFAEAGNSWSSIKEFSPFGVKRSAGLGVRIFLPAFGLLGFDYGWGFDPVAGKPSTGRNPITGKVQGQFHFTIGAAIGEL